MTGGSIETRALALLDEAMDQPTGDRAGWIARQPADPAVRARALALLEGAGGAARALPTGGRFAIDDDAPLPDRIGAYRITDLIGQGGMGAVYRGERITGDFEHVAAIKLIRPGALSDALVERFRRERQTLASLAHPHIARLFDGGETEAGQPYIVMELVDGAPVGQWLEDARPSIETRLALFLDICSAVSFAHQNLIIHHDLTPSNVLVTRDGQVKLIDFGISRPPATDGIASSPREPGEGTRATPGFAAPERKIGAATTLSDVYSLGRLLARLTRDRADDPDLAAIVAEATAEDPPARYPTADALAEDVASYRDGHPVAARHGGRRYAIGKFVGRHRVGVAASAAILLLLVSALGVTLYSYAAAERARVAEAKRFDQLRSLAGYMLFDLNDRLRRVAGNVTARASLAAEAQRYLSGLAATPDASPDLRIEIANGLTELARVQASPIEPNLAEGDKAKASLILAEQQLVGLENEIGPRADIATGLVRIRSYRAMIELHSLKDTARSEASLADAGRTLESVPPSARDATWFSARRLYRRARLEFFDLQERVPDLIREAAAIEGEIAQWPAAIQRSRMAATDRGTAAYYRGIATYVEGKGDHGAASFRQALAIFSKLDVDLPDEPANLYMMGWSAFMGFAAAAEAKQQRLSSDLVLRARDIAQRLLALDPNDDASIVLARNAEEGLSQDYANRGLYPQSIAAQRAVIDREKKRLARDGGGSTGINLAYSETILGVNARKAGDRALACESWMIAERRFTRIEKLGKLMEFHKAFLPGLRTNVRNCAQGKPLSSFVELRL